MDTTRFDWSDEALLSKTAIIQWPSGGMNLTAKRHQEPIALGETEFLYSLVRDEAAARLKLYRILGSNLQPLHPLRLVERLLNERGIRYPGSVKGETLIYLANAWSKEGIGLFDQFTPNNLAIALDLAMVQILLPQVGAMIRDCPTLLGQLRDVMNGFPHSAAFLESPN